MDHATRTVGNVEVTAFLDADFAESPIVEAFPDVPSQELLAAKESWPGMYSEDDRWQLRVRAWLVRHAGGLLLLDTGLGGGTSPTQAWAPVAGSLRSSLAEVGVATHDIDTVALSHVHDDHIGGVLTDDGTGPAFPNAHYVLQTADLEWQRASAREGEEDAAIWQLLATLEEAGVVDAIDGDTQLSDALELHHLPGHTPGHQVLRIASEGRRMLLSGDTWNHPAQLAHPDWPSGPDHHHAQSAAARRAMVAELLSHPGTVVAPTHFPEAFGEIRSGRDGLPTWTPIS